MHTVVALVVFAIGLAATLYYWHNLRQSVDADLAAAYNTRVNNVNAALQGQIRSYENLLRGSAGLFAIHDGLTQSDWIKYYQPYEVRKNYPDVEGIGVDRYLKKSEVAGYLEYRHAQGDASFTIVPAGDRDIYAPRIFIAEYARLREHIRGFDGYADPTRRAAMEHGVKTNQMTMSGTIRLTAEDGTKIPSSVLYFPVYMNGRPLGTADQRQGALLGFVFMEINLKTFIERVTNNLPLQNIAIEMHDAEGGSATTPDYQSPHFKDIKEEPGSIIRTGKTAFFGHDWQVTMAASPNLISERQRQLPEQALWRGLVTCIFFAGLVWYLITDRERSYARQKHEEVQTAKDDLLSLASHQLRTPATVVKQYVGMLLQGYGGEMTERQLQMLGNAYESNERQLEIINQLLYVARLDAGRIILHPKETDISKLLHEVVHDQSQSIKAREQRVSLHLPKRPVMAEVDSHYIRMVLENLLSNASKYTPEKGSIDLTLRRVRGQVIASVKDSGVGISPDARGTIFDKFTRIENELSNDVNGSGVGLYLTQQIVELHHGTIDVESEVGHGSTFTVHIPARAKKPESAERAAG
jgi:signal transduction histidine kinase